MKSNQPLSNMSNAQAQDLHDMSRAGRLHLLTATRRQLRQLRQERLRGRDGHWSYDLAQHEQLLAQYRSQVQTVLQLQQEP